MTTTIRLDGVEFSGGGPGANGLVFNNLVGWYGYTETEDMFDPIPLRNGSFSPEKLFVGKSYPSIEGVFTGEDPAAALAARTLLSRLRNSGRKVLMEVSDDLHTTARWVFVKKVFFPHSRHASIAFAIDCIAPDPFRYSEEISTSTGVPVLVGGIEFPIIFPIEFNDAGGETGRRELTNSGSEPSTVRFTVTGGIQIGFTIDTIESGERMEFNTAFETPDDLPLGVPLGSHVSLDPRLGRAKLDDQSDVTAYITPQSRWTTIPPGETRTFQFNPIGSVSGAPTMTAYLAPAFL